MEDWLLRRLSPVKDSDPRWTGLAKAIQTFWEDNFDSLHTGLVNLRSIYTMSGPDLALKMRDKGSFFYPDWPTEFDQPLAVAWREGEILRKSTEYIIKSTFRRNFRNVSIDWIPLYAPKDEEYGTLFLTEKTVRFLNESLAEDYWLTSRGVVSVDLESMYSGGSFTKSTFSPIVKRLINKLKPLHIVYDGIIYEWETEQDINITSNSKVVYVSKTINVDIYTGLRYDVTFADNAITDGENKGVVCTGHISKNIQVPVGMVYHGPYLDDVELDIMQLDLKVFSYGTVVKDYEVTLNPYNFVYSIPSGEVAEQVITINHNNIICG